MMTRGLGSNVSNLWKRFTNPFAGLLIVCCILAAPLPTAHAQPMGGPRSFIDCNDNGIDDSLEVLSWEMIDRVDAPGETQWGEEISLAWGEALIIGDPDDAQVSHFFILPYCYSVYNPDSTVFFYSGESYGHSVAAGYGATATGSPYIGGAGEGRIEVASFDCAYPMEVYSKNVSISSSNVGELGYAVDWVGTTSDSAKLAGGAPGDDNNGIDAGAVYLFEFVYYGPEPWDYEYVETHQILATDGGAGDRFGSGVSIDEDVLAVTAPGHGEGGAVYIFRFANGVWVEAAKLTPADTSDGGPFGEQIALDGDRILVGTPAVHLGEATIPHMFHFNGANWIEEPAFEVPTHPGPNPTYYSDFGRNIALDSGIAVMSYPLSFDTNNLLQGPQTGRVLVRRWDGSAWVADAEIAPPEIGRFLRFGDALALRGNQLAIGSAAEDAVFVYERCASSLALGDIDADGDVDLDDADALVAVLLASPLSPDHVDRSDLNDDSAQDGLDIQAFTEILLGS